MLFNLKFTVPAIVQIWISLTMLFLAVPVTVTAQDITLRPTISIRGEYDDNVYYTRRFETEDYLTRIKPAFTLDYVTERFDLQSSFDVDIQRYADEEDLDTEDQHYKIDAKYQVMERISVSGNGSYSKDTTLESEIEETGLSDNPRQDRDRYIGGLGLTYKITELSNISVNYSHNKTEYEWSGNVDYDMDSISFSFNSRFDNQLDVITIQPYFYRYDSKTSNVDNYGLSFGWQHPFDETLTLTAFAGARYTKTEYSFAAGSEDSSYSGVADIKLEKIGELYSAEVGYNHDLSYSAYGEPIEKYKIHGYASRRLTERLKLRFSGIVSLTKSDDKYNDRDSRFYGITPSLDYRITENYSLKLAYNYSQSYDKARTIYPRADRNKVWLELHFRFPEKW